MRAHDPLSYIDPRSRAFNGLNMPIPVPMLMPAAPPPPPSFFNNGQMMNPNGKFHFLKTLITSFFICFSFR